MIPRFKPWLGWPEFAALFRCNHRAVARFEKAFAKAFHAVDAVAFPYGRSAQWAFFKAMGIVNAEIIMPAYTCSVVAHAVTLSGNTPRFIDIDLHDYNMNLDEAESAINENTRAIIATHTFGYPQNLDRLEAMVREAEARYGHKIWLMQDCCHAFGAEWKGRMIGTSGDVAVYAFNISKIITSIFGGMLTFQDQAIANKLRAWRDANYRRPHWFKPIQRRLYLLAVFIAFNEYVYGLTLWLQEKTPFLNGLTKAYHLDHKIHFPPDYLSHMMDVEAAVGLVQLHKYPRIIQQRREIARMYHQHFERREGWQFPPFVEGATYSHFVIRVPDRSSLVKQYAARGMQLGELIQYTIPSLPSYSKFDCSRHDRAILASLSTINLPLTYNPNQKCGLNEVPHCKLL
jgi:perosamine synthetase